ncbi:MAG: GntR family transcriptional regulator [Candidatus Rokuibacteriota bacterium]
MTTRPGAAAGPGRRQVPLYRKLAGVLLGDIAQGRLRPGDRLPTEDELGKAFRVSRITVRQAFDILRGRGLVERIAGRGSFVTSPPGLYVMTVNSIEDVLQAGADSDLTVLEWTAVRPAPAVERRLRLSGQRAYVLRSVRRRQGAPLCYSETYTPLDIGRRLDPDDLRRRTVLETIETKLGVQVGGAVEEISAGVADRTLGARLQIARGSPLVIVEMTFDDVSDRPIEYVRTAYRADRFRWRSQLERLRSTPGRRP